MATYFRITPQTAWGSTIYIHSHARSLKDSDNQKRCQKVIEDFEKEIQHSAEEVAQTLEATINYFQLRTDEIKRAGYPVTSDGNPAGMTKRFEEFKKELMAAYDVLTSPGDKVERIRRVKVEDKTKAEKEVDNLLAKMASNNTEKAISEFLNKKENGIDEVIATRLLQMLENKKYRKRAEKIASKNKVITTNDLEKEIGELTVTQIVEILKKQNKKDNKVDFGDTVKKDLLKSAKKKEVLEKIEVFKKLVESAKDFVTNHGEVLSKDAEVAHIINDIMNSKQSNLIKTGYLLEPIIAYMGEEVGKQGRGITNYEQEGNTIKVVSEALGRKTGEQATKKYSLGHQITTDIKLLLGEMEQVVGVSVKLNPQYFRKYERLTSEDMNALLPSYASNEILSSQIMYYLSNYAFLTQMYYPKDDTEYRADFGLDYDVEGPKKGSAVAWTGNFQDIQNSLATLLFIKGVIGSFFLHSNNVNNIDNFYKELQEQGVPLIIQSSVEQYWTVNLLRAIQKLATDGNAINVFNKWSYGSMEELQNRASRLTENFRLVFKDKVDHWANNPPVTANYSGDRYAEIMEWKNAERDMKKIEREMWGTGKYNNDRLMRFFAGKTKLIRYSYKNMMDMAKENK